ncbi:MAG: response regulator [Bdellovibrionales bacterium]|nr:response regulator [Bdellovibrionales bacterium]
MYWSAPVYDLLDIQIQYLKPNFIALNQLIHPDDRDSYKDFLNKIKLLNPNNPNKLSDPLNFDCRVIKQNYYKWFRLTHMIWKSNYEVNKQLDLVVKLSELNSSLNPNHFDHPLSSQEQTLLSFEKSTSNSNSKQQNKKIDDFYKTKKRIFANMTHELHTPLSLILEFSNLLRHSKSKQKTEEYINLILKNGNILKRVITDIFSYSKNEVHEIHIENKFVNINYILDDIISSFHKYASSRNLIIELKNNLPKDLIVLTDEIRLKQILYNLISNSIKFTNKGFIKVIAKFNSTRNFVYFDIIDSGIGIPENEKIHLFSKVQRGEYAHATKTLGSGMGLNLSQNIANELNGKIDLIESKIGKGSHFRMSLFSIERPPSNFPKKNSDLLDSTQSHQLTLDNKNNLFNSFNNNINLDSKLKIFILDDNIDNLKLAKIFLEKLGHEIYLFQQPFTFINHVMVYKPDLLLIDIQMPKMNGFEVAKKIKNNHFLGKIWALTSYEVEDDQDEILANGFDEYIKKPIGLEIIETKIKHYFLKKININS